MSKDEITLIINENKIKKSTNGKYRLNIELTKENLDILLKEKKIKIKDLKIQRACLSEKELQILKLMSKGLTNIEISKILNVSSHTIKAHVANILQKLNVKDRLQAVVKGISENLIDI